MGGGAVLLLQELQCIAGAGAGAEALGPVCFGSTAPASTDTGTAYGAVFLSPTLFTEAVFLSPIFFVSLFTEPAELVFPAPTAPAMVHEQ